MKRYIESVRYIDVFYVKLGYGIYIFFFYGVNLVVFFLEKEKFGFKLGFLISFFIRFRIYGFFFILDYDRSRFLLRFDIIGGGKRSES